jgi:hypothetical protein
MKQSIMWEKLLRDRADLSFRSIRNGWKLTGNIANSRESLKFERKTEIFSSHEIEHLHFICRWASTAQVTDDFLQWSIIGCCSFEFGCSLTVMPINGRWAGCDLSINDSFFVPHPEVLYGTWKSFITHRVSLPTNQSTDGRKSERKEICTEHRHFQFAQTPDEKIATEGFSSNWSDFM